MIPRGSLALAKGLLCFASIVRAQNATSPAAPAVDSTRTAVVTYISGQSVYVGAGRADGVREGMLLEIIRSGGLIATVRAAFLSSHSAACEIVSSTAPPALGDSVRYHPVLETVAILADTGQARSDVATRRPSWERPIRGHAGLRYLTVSQPNSPAGASAFSQPSADVHIDATQLGGSVGFVLDGRSRRTIGATAADASSLDQRTLVYEASLSMLHQGSGTRVSVGRQYSPALSSVSLFDGVTAELNRSQWGMGIFSGVQPDVTTMDYSTEVRESGGYVQLHNAPDASFPWSATTGAVDSRDLGQINREFGFAQVTVSSRLVSLYATQEVDVNRGWKRTAGEAAVSPTSTFATLSIRPTEQLSFDAGVDNRRNVRLYRDYVSPETEFDDAFREGVWGGASVSVLQRFRIAGDARLNRGGMAGASEYYTASLAAGPFARLGLDARVRSTRFTTDNSTGWLHAVSAGTTPFGALHLEIDGGLRTQHMTAVPGATTSLPPGPSLPDDRWIGASLDFGIGRSWYVIASGTRDGVGADLTNQIYCSLLFRF